MDHAIRRWRIPKDFDPVLALILGFADSRFNPGSIKFGEYGPYCNRNSLNTGSRLRKHNKYFTIYSTACMPERSRTEGINPNGLGTSRVCAILSEYSNQKDKGICFHNGKKPPVKNAKT
ncbi:hypothetical protein AVEN_33891-1 [Araneus ventricosus]|uniref:Uncharacterized protein n=1 Tax=Araneus ventricosus TaxID=182803 RepID=A0A4Y2EKG0_ARAVE|nr:hypothetical protein AVEN_33891-1 [Araneus ventricosus]